MLVELQLAFLWRQNCQSREVIHHELIHKIAIYKPFIAGFYHYDQITSFYKIINICQPDSMFGNFFHCNKTGYLI